MDSNVKRQVVSEETSRRVSAILQETATTGTAKNGYIPGYRVAGKTGTSEKIAEWVAQGQQGEKKYIASYCGYAPADDPEIIMLVFFDEPTPQGGQVYGGAIAGPPFAKTMEEILPYLGIERKYTEAELAKLDTTTPNIVGKTLDQAKSAVAAKELKYVVYGSGDKVVQQVPEAGQTIPNGGDVYKRQVISRRLQEYEDAVKRGEQDGFGRLPDLILLDGGKGHVAAIRPVLEAFGLEIPLFGMVKDDKHRTRAIAKDGGEIAINSNRKAFTLVSTIQDEVHRFAIGYHRQSRKKASISSTLTAIEGIGMARAKALLKHFKTIRAISTADLEELEQAPGMNKPAAKHVYQYFHPENES